MQNISIISITGW